MIVREFYRTRKDGVNLYKTYSDQKLQIKQYGTNRIYNEAIDVENAPYTYSETDTPIVERKPRASSDSSTIAQVE
jgi:hypothetical protein